MIETAIQKGVDVFVTNTNGLVFTIRGALADCTGETVTVIQGRYRNGYDENGNRIESRLIMP